MHIQFTIKCPPFSINKAYYRNRQLTQDARKWRKEFLLQLQDKNIQKDLAAFHAEFDPKLHGIKASYRFCFPSDKLLTKKGTVSARSCDLTNIEKLVQDNIFDNRFNGRKIDNIIISNLDIDDKFIIQCHSCKILSPVEGNYLIQIGIELLPLQEHICPFQ